MLALANGNKDHGPQGSSDVQGLLPLHWVQAHSCTSTYIAGGRKENREGGSYQHVLLLKLGNPLFSLLLVFLDGLVDTFIEGVKLCFPLFLLFQSILKNVQANDDKFVLVGECLLRKLEVVLGAGLGVGRVRS